MKKIVLSENVYDRLHELKDELNKMTKKEFEISDCLCDDSMLVNILLIHWRKTHEHNK